MPRLNNPGNDWRCDPATPGQLSVIRRKQLASDEECRTMTKGYAFALIKSNMPPDPGRDSEASPAQTKLVRDLCNNLGEAPGPYLRTLSRSSASVIISQLTARVREDNKLVPGLYALDGEFYQVAIGEGGFPYASLMVKLLAPEPSSNGYRSHRFVYTRGAVIRLKREHALTYEQAVAFGQETSSCIACGIQLNPEIKTKDGQPRWIGPKCEKKMGWA